MKTRTVLSVIASLALAAIVLAQASQKPATASATPTFTPASDLKWEDLDPKGAPGVKVADLWGSHSKGGAFGAYFKLPAGFAAPLHTHSYPMKVIFVSGTYIQAPEGKPEVRLGPGAYMFQPAGNYRHTTSCDKSADCVFFVESPGPFDLKPVAAKKSP
jgi:hypothetical protein